MDAVRAFAADGGPVLGICNGFQILCEAGLLPGALLANRQLEFLCADVTVTVESGRTVFTDGLRPGDELVIDQARRGTGSPTSRSTPSSSSAVRSCSATTRT
jgi:phosphoribosylformylglycinamidine synthase